MKKHRLTFLAILASCLAGSACVWFQLDPAFDYKAPRAKSENDLADDRLEDKKSAFDAAVVDRRPLGEWALNASAAVLRLDVPAIKPDREADLLTLHPSYQAAVAAARGQHEHETFLPSVNMVDGKARQFDDGLHAALDLAYYRGLEQHLRSHVELVRRLYEKVQKESPEAAFLAAGLQLAGIQVAVHDRAARDRYVHSFLEREGQSKPIGFYDWNENLRTCFRFERFLQTEFTEADLAVPQGLTHYLVTDKALEADYRKALQFYARLSNPHVCLSLLDLPSFPLPGVTFAMLCHDRKVARQTVAFFPPSSSRESLLFEKLFANGLPPSADLMQALVQRIRSGSVDLQPQPDSGWFDYQVYALETLLLPEKGAESQKLLLTRAYKKRMLEAFQALLTRRWETHVETMSIGMGMSAALSPALPGLIKPRLRVEPCPSYFVRTARAYAFLGNFLQAAIGRDGLQSLHGLRQEGERELDLATELDAMRDLFYGLYLVSAEDLGMKPAFLPGEDVNQERCYQLATDWLGRAFEDKDLASDTRVSVPVFLDPNRNVTRLWATLGVRLARLEVRYERPPHLRPRDGGDWQVVETSRLGTAEYLIPVDEFAEVELHGLRALTRAEFRIICDRERDRDAILQALRK